MSDLLQELASDLGPLVPPPAADPATSSSVASDATASASAPAPAPVSPSSPPPPAVQFPAFAAKGYHLDALVRAECVVAAAEILDRRGFGLDAVTGVDWLAKGEIEVVYDYFHPTAPWRVVVRARVPRIDPAIATISGVFPGANWHERETHDFFGVRFDGHPNLEPLLLPEDATYHPLRKDFTA